MTSSVRFAVTLLALTACGTTSPSAVDGGSGGGDGGNSSSGGGSSSSDGGNAVGGGSAAGGGGVSSTGGGNGGGSGTGGGGGSSTGCGGFGGGLGEAMLVISRLSYDFGPVATQTPSATGLIFIETNSSLHVDITGPDAAAFTATTQGRHDTFNIVVLVTFHPLTTGAANATLTLSVDNGSVGRCLPLTGLGVAPGTLTFDRTSATLSAQPNTVSTATTFTVTNSGSVATGALAIALEGSDASLFTLGANTCTSLAPHASCSVDVSFEPGALHASYGAALSVSDPSGDATAAQLTGLSWLPAALTFDLPSCDFGSIATGSSDVRDVHVQNTGDLDTGPLQLPALSGSNDFTVQFDNCTGFNLTGGNACIVRLQFTPTATGPESTTLSVSNGTLTATMAVTGTGT